MDILEKSFVVKWKVRDAVKLRKIYFASVSEQILLSKFRIFLFVNGENYPLLYFQDDLHKNYKKVFPYSFHFEYFKVK